MSLSQAKFILISSAKPIQPFPRKTRGEEGGEKECCFAHIKKGKEKKSSSCLIESCGAIMIGNRICGDKARRRLLMFLADSSLVLDAPFSKDFSRPSFFPLIPLVPSSPALCRDGAHSLTVPTDGQAEHAQDCGGGAGLSP